MTYLKIKKNKSEYKMREDIRNLIFIALVLILAAFLGYNATSPSDSKLIQLFDFDTNGLIPV